MTSTPASALTSDLAYELASLDRYESDLRKRPKPKKPHYDGVHVVAWDGEGLEVADGEPQPYVYLAASTGDDWLNMGGLSTIECFEALLDVGARYPDSKHFIFGGGYDVNQWLCDIDEGTLRYLWTEGRAKWGRYRIEYRPRKTFYIRDNRDRKLRMWDAYPWFQSSFVRAISKNLGETYSDLGLIREMKARRSQFDESEIDAIKDYTQRELRALVRLVHDLMSNLDAAQIYPNRWDGPGAAAAALLKKNGIKRWKGETPRAVREAAAVAYSGGRMEVMQYGNYDGPVWHYDINSAYPAAMRDLPPMSRGRWAHHKGGTPPIQDAGLYHVEWGRIDADWPDLGINRMDVPGLSDDGQVTFGLRQEHSPGDFPALFPFPYRLDHGEIYYPPAGKSWAWGAEVAVALKHRAYWQSFGFDFKITEAYILEYVSDVRPFAWVQDLYDRRRQLKREGNGAEKAIKLGLNSLYGKLAQTLGWSEDRWPPYYQIEWAGMITSKARAMLLDAAMQNPDAIIMFATDGIFSTAPLDLAESNLLGEWEGEKHDGLTVVQSGVYWVKEGDEWRIWSRGFNPEQLSRDAILTAWKRKRQSIGIEQSRFITLGSALAGTTISPSWRAWRTAPRTLSLEPLESGKRTAPKGRRTPGTSLVRTAPAFAFGNADTNGESAKYERAWKDFLDRQEDGVNVLVYEAEITDSEI